MFTILRVLFAFGITPVYTPKQKPAKGMAYNEASPLDAGAEIDRCMTDAVQVITGCSLGHRSLKDIDYARFAATFVNLQTGKAVRATVGEHFTNETTIEDTLKKLAGITDNELITTQEVAVAIQETDLPGLPRWQAVCEACGERVVDGREIIQGNKVLCRACAGSAYIRVIGK